MIPDKSYFRIGEVSRILDVEPYVVRFWESEFKVIRPERSRSDHRVYRRKDLENLLLIKKLLYNEGYTIAGAKKQLRKIRGETVESSVKNNESQRLAILKAGLIEIRSIVG
jgi:DNA-binding transcriptional MerR regulator